MNCCLFLCASVCLSVDVDEILHEDDLCDFSIFEPTTSSLPDSWVDSPTSLPDLDPIIFVAYSDPAQFAPVSSDEVEVAYAHSADSRLAEVATSDEKILECDCGLSSLVTDISVPPGNY